MHTPVNASDDITGKKLDLYTVIRVRADVFYRLDYDGLNLKGILAPANLYRQLLIDFNGKWHRWKEQVPLITEDTIIEIDSLQNETVEHVPVHFSSDKDRRLDFEISFFLRLELYRKKNIFTRLQGTIDRERRYGWLNTRRPCDRKRAFRLGEVIDADNERYLLISFVMNS